MIELKNRLLVLYRQVVGSIAFYPAIIALGLTCLAVGTLVLEQYGATEFLEKHIQVLVIYDQDTARTILSVLIGGLISLTVFSFSMVMILLNQASSYFSPRLLPGLISNKSHQIVLGCYIGTIVYCLLVLINIYKPSDEVSLPGLAILMAIILGIFCLGMFVYFIHNISTSIQASNVLHKVFQDTQKNLKRLQNDKSREIAHNENVNPPETSFSIFNHYSGYLQEISEDSLLELAEKNDLLVRLEVTRGMFVHRNLPIAKLDKEVNKELAKEICSCFQLSNREIVKDNYVLGFKQLTEVAVKAMSPGINDPGTALTAIDFMTELLEMRLQISDYEWKTDHRDIRRLFFKPVQFKTLIYNVMAALRQYVKHDAIVVQKLFVMLNYLLSQKNLTDGYRHSLEAEKNALLAEAEKHIENKHDQSMLKRWI